MEKCEFTLCSEPAIQQALVDLAFIRVCKVHFEAISSGLKVKDYSCGEVEDELVMRMERLEEEDLALVETGEDQLIKARAFQYHDRALRLEASGDYEEAAVWLGKTLLLLKRCAMDQLVVKAAYRLGYLLCIFLARPEEGVEKVRLSYQLSSLLAPGSEETFATANFLAQNLMETFQTAEAREVLNQAMAGNPHKDSECFLRSQMLLSWSVHLHGEEWPAELLMLRALDVAKVRYPDSMLLAEIYFYLSIINKPMHAEVTGGAQLYLDCSLQVVEKCKVAKEGLLLALYFSLLHPNPAGFCYQFGKGMTVNLAGSSGKLAAFYINGPKMLWRSPLGTQVYYLLSLTCSHKEAISLAAQRFSALKGRTTPALAQELMLYCRAHPPRDCEAWTYMQQALSIYARLKGVRSALLHHFNALQSHFANWSEDLPYLDPLLDRARANLDSELGLQATVIKQKLYNKHAGALNDFPMWVRSTMRGSHSPLYACLYVSAYVDCWKVLGLAVRRHFFNLVKPLLTHGVTSVFQASCLLSGARMLSKPNMLRAVKVALQYLKQYSPQSLLTAYGLMELATCSAGPLASESASQANAICNQLHSGAEFSMLTTKVKSFFYTISEKRTILSQQVAKIKEQYPDSHYLLCGLMEQTVTEAQTGGLELAAIFKRTFDLYWQLLPYPKFELPFFGRLAKVKLTNAVKPGLLQVLKYCVEQAPITFPVGIFTYIMKCCQPGPELVAATEIFVQRCRQANVKPKKLVEALGWQGDVMMACRQSIQGSLSYREACVLIKTHSLQQKYLPLLFKELSVRQAPVSRESEVELLGIVKEVYARTGDCTQAFNLSQMQAACQQLAQAEESSLPEFTPRGFDPIELRSLFRIYRDLQLP